MRMRTLKLRPSFPSCIDRKVSDVRTKRSLEMGDFPLHILESRRRERLAELKAECLELKQQLSEHDLQDAILREEATIGNGPESKPRQVLSGRHSKSMHELRQTRKGDGATLTTSPSFDESMRRRREERLQNIRTELEQFAIKYSIGEYAETIDGIRSSSQLREEASENLTNLTLPSPTEPPPSGPLQGVDAVNAGVLLRIQRQRELELQRARMELKHLAFRLKHKLDEENGPKDESS